MKRCFFLTAESPTSEQIVIFVFIDFIYDRTQLTYLIWLVPDEIESLKK